MRIKFIILKLPENVHIFQRMELIGFSFFNEISLLTTSSENGIKLLLTNSRVNFNPFLLKNQSP